MCSGFWLLRNLDENVLVSISDQHIFIGEEGFHEVLDYYQY
jgi:hypothetical protein